MHFLPMLMMHHSNHRALPLHIQTYIIGNQHTSGTPAAGWLGTKVSQPTEYWDKYFAVEAIESYAEAAAASPGGTGAGAPTSAKAVAALVAHQRQFWNSVSGKRFRI